MGVIWGADSVGQVPFAAVLALLSLCLPVEVSRKKRFCNGAFAFVVEVPSLFYYGESETETGNMY